MFPESLQSAAEVSAQCSLSVAKKLYSFSRSALWVGTTSFMILVLPVVFETERLQLEQQQLQQQRQVSSTKVLHKYEQLPCNFIPI
uniref:Mitochondrial import receptor subunit TOM22 homolog n=2 Tax=Sinocyclocheilus grahami TaxID=75366 RepID=A0A672Q943_SINGR